METVCRCTAIGDCAAYPMAKERPVLIVFDLDGTIADSAELARVLFRRVFALMGYGEISDELADSFNGPSADEVCRIMGIGPDRRPLYNQLIDEVETELVKTIGRMYPGMIEMLEALSRYAVLALLTNGAPVYCETCMNTFGLAPYISLHSGFASGVSKAQRMLQWAGELDARRIIVVGDRATDIDNARLAGAYAVGVTYGMGSEEELSGADVLCANACDVVRACMEVIRCC